jgi:hypothetical protein
MHRAKSSAVLRVGGVEPERDQLAGWVWVVIRDSRWFEAVSF